ncbi:MAG: hypothetical protein WC373_07340 [Smithella sp.]|jgi:protein-S-isoprenylcysteine O-methyltransferase Ste14
MFFTLHILLMATATLVIIVGVSAAMFFRKKKNWLKIHKTVNSSGVALIMAGIIMAFSYVYTTGGEHLDGNHQIAGLVASALALITLLAGFYQLRARNKSMTRTAHRWLGRFSLLMFLAAIILGLILINII